VVMFIYCRFAIAWLCT